MIDFITFCAIPRRYIAVALRPDMDAWAGPKPGYNNLVSHQARTGFLENFCTVVVDASESDNRSRLVPRWPQDA